jgi:hypothetical protein
VTWPLTRWWDLPVCGILLLEWYWPQQSSQATWPLTKQWDYHGLSHLWHLTQEWYWPQQSNQVTRPLTTWWNLPITMVIPSVGPFTGMGLTSAIQPSDLTSDQLMGLANYHGYPVWSTFHRYGTDLSNPAKWPNLWLRDGTCQLPWLSVCRTFHRYGTDLSNPAGDLWPRDGMDLPVHEAVQSIVDPERLVTREDAVPAEKGSPSH